MKINGDLESPIRARYCRIEHRPIILMIVVLILHSCSPPRAEDKLGLEKPIIFRDSTAIYCDQEFKYLIDQEVKVYEASYPGQTIKIIYQSEAEVLHHLKEDSFATIIVGRLLKKSEEETIFRQSNLQLENKAFAKDAIALIAGLDFANDTIKYSDIIALLTTNKGQYKLVFEGKGSGAVAYMFEQFTKGGNHSAAYSVKDLAELSTYLAKDPKAIGFIPFNYFSDEDDTISNQLLKKVKQIYISRTDSISRNVVSTASQSQIADGSYPFARPINLISHTIRDNVGTGFANFLMKEQSGRIILKSGLVPAVIPSRTINVNTDGIKTK